MNHIYVTLSLSLAPLSCCLCPGQSSRGECHAESHHQNNRQLPCVWSPAQTHEETGHESQHQAAPLQAERCGQQNGEVHWACFVHQMPQLMKGWFPLRLTLIFLFLSPSSGRRACSLAQRRRRNRQRTRAAKPVAGTEICCWSLTAGRGRTFGWRRIFGMQSAFTWLKSGATASGTDPRTNVIGHATGQWATTVCYR